MAHFRKSFALIVTLGFWASSVAATTSFQDVAPNLGLTETEVAFGAAWADVDGDGRVDVWMGNHNRPAALYINDPENGFVPYTNFVGLSSADMHGAAWGDFDSDGDPDLLISVGAQVGNGAGPNQLFVNTGSQLVESAAAYGVDYELARGRHATWFDWNNDSYLDVLYLAENNRPTPPQAPSRIFTYDNTTNTFQVEPWTVHRRNATNFAQLILSNPVLNDESALLVTQEGNGWPDEAYTFDANGLTTVTSAFALPSIGFVRDVVPGDYNNDGQIDLIVVNQSGVTHLRQQSSGMVDVTSTSGFSSDRAVFSVSADFDNDKDLDLYVARGHIGQDFNMVNDLYYNNGDGTFTKAANASGANGTLTGFVSGATTADYNNDGFVDLFVTNGENWFTPAVMGPIQFFENQPNGNNWLKVKLVGTLSNRDAIGAKVFLTSGGTTQLREQNGGTHHRSQDDRRLHFGLASDPLATLLEVHWPNGDIQTFTNVTPNQILTVHQSNPALPNVAPVAAVSAQQGADSFTVALSSAGSHDPDGIIESYSWNFGDGNSSTAANPTHTYSTAGSYTITLTVTDDLAAIDTATTTFTAEIEVSVEAVGANPQNSNRLIDSNPDDSLDLSTFWANNSQLATAWVTLDIGESIDVDQVLLAPRGDINYDFDITIGDNLNNGVVTGPVTATCSTPGGGAQAPSTPKVCLVPTTSGRYVTVRSTNRVSLRLYGIRALAAGITNAVPLPAFTAIPDSSGLTVAFNGNASIDAEGPISSYGWDFGDGNSSAGATTNHTYIADGTYVISLTVTDNVGVSSTVAAAISLTSPQGPSQLAASVEAVGNSATQQNNLVDETTPGVQNLSTKWVNSNGDLDDAWFTLDLGSTETVSRVDLAPRGNLQYGLQLRISDTLNGSGQTTGGTVLNCTVPATGGLVPTVMSPCSVPDATGRYVMVTSRFRNRLPMHGAAVFGPGGSGGPATNIAPSAFISAIQVPTTLDVDFDGSASSDSDGSITGYAWNFGDGSPLEQAATTTHSYAADGTVLVSLAVTDDGGAVTVVAQSLELEAPSPNPIFQVQPQSTAVAEGESVTFSAFAGGTQPITYQWRLNGSNIAGATQTDYTIAATTVGQTGEQYSVVATNSNGSTASAVAILTVTPANTPPTASLSIDSTSGDAPLTVNLSGSASTDSDGVISSYDWDFGDGTSASGVNVTKAFTAGNFTITLTVTDDDGATAQTTASISVNALPIASFSATPPGGTAPLTVVFDASASEDPDGTLVSYAWDLGDGNTATTVTPSHAYTSAGDYTVTLTVTDDLGATRSTSQVITVSAPSAPTINGQPQSVTVEEGQSATFTVVADGTPVLTYQWRLGGIDIAGATANSYQLSNAQLADSGSSFSVTVTNQGGTTVSSAAILTVELPNVAPVATFIVNPTATPLTKAFDASSSSDSDGTISSWEWDFGDGNTGTGVTPVHSYQTSGNYSVTLTVTDDDGATDTSNLPVLANGPPNAAFTLTPSTGTAPVLVSADGTASTDTDGSIVSHVWSFGDGNSASGAQSSNTFVNPGTYTVELTVTDNLGATNSSSQSIVVEAPVPPSITTQPANQTAIEGNAASFSVSADGTSPLSFQWLRNGNPISGATAPTYTLGSANAGDDGALFSVNVSNIAGLATSAEAALTVLIPPSIVTHPSDVTVDPGQSAAFNASASGTDPLAYQWQRDGSDIPGATGPTFVFSNAQPQDSGAEFRAVVTNAAGTQQTDVAVLTVNALNLPPMAAFTITDPNIVRQRDFDASASSDSDGTITSYLWDFGDGNTGTGSTTSHTYTGPGTYLITLTITDDDTATAAVSNSTIVTVPAVIAATGSAASNQDSSRILDELSGGEQDLGTFWQNNNGNSNAWFTIDLGSEQIVEEVLVAVRSDSANRLNFRVGNSLSNGKVGGSADGDCRTNPLGVVQPPALVACPLDNPTSGRYITVNRLFQGTLRVYGVEIGVMQPNTPPAAAFGVTIDNLTRTLSANATASGDAEGSLASYQWDFGDGNTGTGVSVMHSYTSDGTYTLSLAVTDNDGAVDSASQTLTTLIRDPLAAVPAAIAAVGDNAADQNLLLDTLVDGNQDLSTQWSNTGSLSTAWFTLDLGDAKTIGELHIATRGDAAFDLDISVGNTLNAGKVSGGTTTFCTTPGVDGSMPSASHVCTIPYLTGRYLTIASTNLTPLSVYGVSVLIDAPPANLPPVAAFSASQVANTLQANYDAGASTDVDGSITDYVWDFGDGNTASGVTASHTYASAGDYSVSLTVTDDDLASNSSTQTLSIAAVTQPPVISTQPQDVTVDEGSTATFTVIASGAPAPGYQWQRDGIDIAGATSASYTTPATIAADTGALFTVTAINIAGSATSAAATLTVTPTPNQPPVADFSESGQADGVSFVFDANGSSDSDGTITGYAWNFGDGITANGVSTTHSYAADGNYTVTLTVTDDDGATNSSFTSVTAAASGGGTPVKAAITVHAVPANNFKRNRAIDELSNGDQALSSYWNGNGDNGSGWITLDLGSSDTVSEVRVAPRGDRTATVAITVGNSLQNNKVDAAVTGSCQVFAAIGATPQALTECPITPTNGRYVTVQIPNTSFVRFYGIEVFIGSGGPPPANNPPVAALSATAVANTLMANFDASGSSDSDGAIVEYSWDFGDGTSTTTSNATTSHTYASEGSYTASVTVTDDDNATAAASASVTVTEAAGGNPGQVAITVVAAGGGLGTTSRAIDELAGGEQNLDTYWRNSTAGVPFAWITVDLGSVRNVDELRVAPHGRRAYNLGITIGRSLQNGQADGPETAVCSLPGGGLPKPSALTTCTTPLTSGRYITIASKNFSLLRLYGLEVYAQ